MRKYFVLFFVVVMVATIGFAGCSSKKEEAPAPAPVVEQAPPADVPDAPADNAVSDVPADNVVTEAPADAPAEAAPEAPAK